MTNGNMTAAAANAIRADAKEAVAPLIGPFNQAYDAFKAFKNELNHDPAYFKAAKDAEIARVEAAIANPRPGPPSRTTPEIMRARANGYQPGDIDVREVLKPEDATRWDALEAGMNQAKTGIEKAVAGAFEKNGHRLPGPGESYDTNLMYDRLKFNQELVSEALTGKLTKGDDRRQNRCGAQRGSGCSR